MSFKKKKEENKIANERLQKNKMKKNEKEKKRERKEDNTCGWDQWWDARAQKGVGRGSVVKYTFFRACKRKEEEKQTLTVRR